MVVLAGEVPLAVGSEVLPAQVDGDEVPDDPVHLEVAEVAAIVPRSASVISPGNTRR